MTPKRLLLAKTGLDCHDTGIVTVAQAMREAGYEVIYLGLHNSPREVVKAAIEEDVDGIGVSYLSGQHMTQMRLLLEAMREQGCRIPIFCGGVIPADDAAALRDMGVAAVVRPGTLTEELMRIVAGVVASGPKPACRLRPGSSCALKRTMMLDCIVRRNAARFAARPALIEQGRTLTWAGLNARVDAAAAALAAADVASGDRVAILMGNRTEYFELYFACSRIGAIAVPLNYRLTPGEGSKILGHADPSLLVCDTKHRASAAAMLRSLGRPQLAWCVEDPRSTEEPAADAMSMPIITYEQALSSAPKRAPPHQGTDRDTFAIFYTSGTTGLPKGAMVSHLNLEMNGYNQLVADASRPDDVNLVATPVYHMGAVFMAVTYMMLGCTQVILPQFSPAAWLATLERTRATVSLLIPTMINAILGAPEFARHDLSSLRLVFYGGGPMPRAVLERAMCSLRCSFTQGYGLTETLEATFLTAADHVLDGTPAQRRRLESAGREAIGARDPHRRRRWRRSASAARSVKSSCAPDPSSRATGASRRPAPK